MADTRFNSGSVSEVRVYSLAEMGSDLRVGVNFELHEFACNDGSDIVLIHPKLIELLDRIRFEIGAPIYINSAYRSHHHNHMIGGAQRSKHLLGFAADVRSPGLRPSQIAGIAEDLGAGGVGRYDRFTHVDVYGTERRWRP